MDADEQPKSPPDTPEGEDAVVESSGVAGGEGSSVAGDPFSDDPTYRAAVIDLLGALAYGELTAFSRLAADAEMAPSQPEKAALARVAVAEFHHFEALTRRLSEMGVDPEQAAWCLVGVFWMRDVAYLMGLGDDVWQGSTALLETVLGSILPQSPEA